MKSKDLQKVVLSKYEDGDQPKKIFHDLNGVLGLRTIERWCQMIRRQGSIELIKSPGRPRSIRTKAAVQKIKRMMNARRPPSTRKLALKMGISRTSVRRVLKNDLKLRAYKKIIEPFLTDEHKEKRKRFASWARTNFRKEDTMRIVFSDEKMFDIDGVYNSQNERVWAVDRSEADAKGGIKRKRKYPQKVMVWLAVCSEGVSPMVIFEDGTVDHDRYIREVLPIALQFGDELFGDRWTFQQDGAKPHTHKTTQTWCDENFPAFIDKDRWPPNSPDLNPLDYSIWDELALHIKWDRVTSKQTLINELKRSVNRIRQDVVFESCATWSNRLHRMANNNGEYLR